MLGAYIRNDKEGIAQDIDWVYNLFPRLRERSWQKGGTLSGGEQQMLAVGRALMSRPDLVMLDEPSLGLAPLLVREIFDIILKINAEGKTVLLVEQNALAALSIAHYAYVLEVGRVVAEARGRNSSKIPRSRKLISVADLSCASVDGYLMQRDASITIASEMYLPCKRSCFFSAKSGLNLDREHSKAYQLKFGTGR